MAVFTDQTAILAVRDFLDVPVALVEGEPGEKELSVSDSQNVERPSSGSNAKAWRIHQSHACESDLKHFHWGCNHLATPARAEIDQTALADQLAELNDGFDLAEPFVRIREAIEEARGAGGG